MNGRTAKLAALAAVLGLASGLAMSWLGSARGQSSAPAGPPAASTSAPASAPSGKGSPQEPIRLDPAQALHALPALRGVATEWMDERAENGALPRPRGVEKGYGVTMALEEEDIALAARTGVRTVRLAMEHTALEERDTPGKWREPGFQRLEQIVGWYAKSGIGVVLDLHNPMGRDFGGDPRLWQDPAFQDRLVAIWKEIAIRFNHNPGVVAYEPVNEPEPRTGMTMPQRYAVWNALAARVCKAIREVDPDRAIIIDCVEYANPSAFRGLEPLQAGNVTYSFHWYAPSEFHSQKRPWTTSRGTFHYPDRYGRTMWNRDAIAEAWQPAIDFAKKNNAPLFCGEFGCVSDVPEMEDMVWLLDIVSLFDQNAIGWTYYHYMFRTVEPYWQSHFDCNLFIRDLAGGKLLRLDRKVDLLGDLMRLKGKALRHDQPSDPEVTVYASLSPEGAMQVFVSNKSRQSARSVSLALSGGPWDDAVAAKRMAVGTGGYVAEPPLKLQAGRLDLTLQPLTILRLTATPRK